MKDCSCQDIKKKWEKRDTELKGKKSTHSFIKSKDITKPKIYYIHDNGGVPFEVTAKKDGIVVKTFPGRKYPGNDTTKRTETALEILSYEGLWPGCDNSFNKMHGNSILVKINDHDYVHIGQNIFFIRTEDIILDYVAEMGPNDVPYPVAIGTKYVYLMIDDGVRIPRSKLKFKLTLNNYRKINDIYYDNKKWDVLEITSNPVTEILVGRL